MTAFLLTALFIGSALVAFGAIADSLRRYGPAALALHRQARACPAMLDGRYTVRLHASPVIAAQVLRPVFTARQAAPAPGDHDWRAAA